MIELGYMEEIPRKLESLSLSPKTKFRVANKSGSTSPYGFE